MNKDVLNHNEYEQIARLLSGEMDNAEEEKFRNEVLADSLKLNAFEELKSKWNDIPEPEAHSKIDADKAWNSLDKRISEESDEYSKSAFPTWMKIAASWLILIAIGTAVWFFSQPAGQDKSLITLMNYNDNTTHVHTLQDGSVVYLANNTTLNLPMEFDGSKRYVNVDGEAFFDIKHKPEQPFFVETKQAVIQVIGTSFNIKTSDNNIMEVFVENGKVKAQLRKDQNKYVYVKHGELLTISDNEMIKTTGVDFYNTAWRRQHMHFKDERLENIVTVLNRNYDVVFDIEDEKLYGRKLTVTFYNDSVNNIAELIAKALNIEFVKQSESEISFKAKN